MTALLMKILADRRSWRALGLTLLIAFAGFQSLRLGHAKADLRVARAALVDTSTGRRWQAEAEAGAAGLAACRAGLGRLDSALSEQSAAIAATRAQGAAATLTAQQALAVAQAEAERAKASAGRLLAAKPGPGACGDADALILGSLKP